MPPIARNVLAVVIGVIAGSLVNMGLIMVSGSIIAPPAGADVRTMEGLKASLPLFEPRHFLLPFLAHALGTLVGAGVTAFVSIGRKRQLAMLIGGIFLAGGVANVLMLPSPPWFTVLDLVGAYLPMAWLGGRLGERASASQGAAASGIPATGHGEPT